ncbi:hypothetical protein BKH41_01935 [Helicobacter sp. 12S02232-10]|uniref:type IV secretion system protein n=1 Tax=Helicobacter sp. 12S02232-10 TaxID=1476197 RepID=UPI000BA60CFA|nr:type IV secretion system protein [Helicobacter sp. 12S02232-10]PAF49448.1 hypothetical protein BKH41_01935 [Helicobacter sp. 12S02232-10]
MDTNLFESLIGIFTGFLNNFADNMAKNFSILLHTTAIVNVITILLILLFVIKKLKNNDMFEFKTIINLLVFILFVGFYNWARQYPDTFNQYFDQTLFYLSNKISDAIVASGNSNLENQANVTSQNAISILIKKTFGSIETLVHTVFKDIGVSNFITYFVSLALTLAIAIIEIIFILFVCYFVIIISIEITIYKAFALLILPLIYFSQTRGFAWAYIKKILSLTFYQPLILLLATLNFKVTEQLLKYIPDEPKQGFIETLVQGTKKIAAIDGILTMILIMSFLCLLLIKQIPAMIDALFGTSTGIQGMNDMGKAALSAGGAVFGGLAGAAKSGYQGAGGGIIGGLVGAGLNMATAGLGSKVGGNIVGKGIDTAVGAMGGNKVKSAITKGVSFGTSQIAKAFSKGDK